MLTPEFYDGNAADRANVTAAFAALNQLASTHAGVASVTDIFTKIPVAFDAKFFPDGGTATFEYRENGQSFLAVNPGQTSGNTSDTAGSSENHADRSFARTVFHELFHAATLLDSSNTSSYALPENPGINFNEAAAIFAENLLFAPDASESFRMGHVPWNLAAGPGIPGTPRNYSVLDPSANTGMSAFAWITTGTGAEFSGANGSGTTFSQYSADGIYGVTKTYMTNDIGFGHYIRVIGQNNLGFISYTKDGIGVGSGFDPMISSMMGVGSNAIKSSIGIVANFYRQYSDIGLPKIDVFRILGVGADTYYDRAKGSDKTYLFNGLNYEIHDKDHNVIQRLASISVPLSADDSSQNILLVGASNPETMPNTSDSITGGSGSDFVFSAAVGGNSVLEGGSGNDVIFGAGKVGDRISGGADNDLLIGRGLGALYDGGLGDKDTLSYHHFAAINWITVNTEFNAVQTPFGTDSYANIDYLIGTSNSDVFNLQGEHPVIYAGQGSDTFTGSFSSKVFAGRGIDTFDFRTGPVISAFTPWALLDSIEVIQGSNGDDSIINAGTAIFRNTEPNAPLWIYGNGGRDTIELNGSINVDGGSGNDTVFFISGGAVTLTGGADEDTLDFTKTLGSRLTVKIEGANGSFQIDDGVTLRFTSFEKFTFGGMTLHLNAAGTFTGGVGRNSIYGGDGKDDITVGGTGGFVYAGGSDDVIHSSGLEYVYGEAGNDRLYAGNSVSGHLSGAMKPGGAAPWYNDGDDYLVGGAQVDFLDGGTGTNELHGGGGYDEFFSNGYGENYFYGEADGGCVRYGFAARGGYPEDPDLATIRDMGAYFEVRTTSDRGQSYHVDHLYDIDKVVFNDRTYMLTPGMSLDTGLFM